MRSYTLSPCRTLPGAWVWGQDRVLQGTSLLPEEPQDRAQTRRVKTEKQDASPPD